MHLIFVLRSFLLLHMFCCCCCCKRLVCFVPFLLLLFLVFLFFCKQVNIWTVCAFHFDIIRLKSNRRLKWISIRAFVCVCVNENKN